MSDPGEESRTADEAALWRVDLADIAKQTDVPTEVLLDALMGASVRSPTRRALLLLRLVNRASGLSAVILQLSSLSTCTRAPMAWLQVSC